MWPQHYNATVLAIRVGQCNMHCSEHGLSRRFNLSPESIDAVAKIQKNFRDFQYRCYSDEIEQMLLKDKLDLQRAREYYEKHNSR